MATINIVKSVVDEGTGHGANFVIRNCKLLHTVYDGGINVFALPESDATAAIVTKTLGSTLKMSVQWTVKEEPNSIATNYTITNPVDQWKYLTGLDGRNFPPKSIQDSYQIVIDGIITNCNILQITLDQGEGLTTYSATIDLIIGSNLSDL